MTFTMLLAALLALAAGTLDLFTPDGQRLGQVREGPGGRIDVFDKESSRIGWGRRSPDGSVELFDMKGNRLCESRGGRIIVDPRRLRGKGGR